MPVVDHLIESEISQSTRARQVESLFDVPAQEKARLEWRGSVPIEQKEWSVGLIVGPSGAGKSTLAKALFTGDYHPELEWRGKSVIDDVAPDKSVQDIAASFSAVGFNTIPAWLRPFGVLSNGERFRVDLARRLLELPDPIIVDEFTSVVDRQVAKIGSHAVQKFVRRNDRRFVAVTCHYDVIDWLQPDWILEPATMGFEWRCLRRRPDIGVEIARVEHATWELFAPFHYLSAELSKAAACYCLFVDGQPAAFAGMLHFPHDKVKNLKRCSRLVTLPDWQGLGLAFVLIDTIGAAYGAVGMRTRTYPAHPALVRAFDRSQLWKLTKKPGQFSPMQGVTASIGSIGNGKRAFGGRPCATFEYTGPSMTDVDAARTMLAGD